MIKLQSTGQMPFEFEGQSAFEGSTEIHKSAERDRFHDIEIYESEYDWVLRIGYTTRWSGEHDYSEVWRAETLSQLIDIICEYDPLKYLAGYPTGQRFEEKQQRLEIQIQRDWEALKTYALSGLSTPHLDNIWEQCPKSEQAPLNQTTGSQ
jgi:hypothetical protein